jgi:hypothetical protein
MTLDRDTIQYRKSQADSVINRVLADRLVLGDAIRAYQIARIVFPEFEEMSSSQQNSAIGFCKRRMGAQRQRAYNRIATEGLRPTFFPFPFGIGFENSNGRRGVIYAYINAINEPYVTYTVLRMEACARGLNNDAGLLRSVSGNSAIGGEY